MPTDRTHTPTLGTPTSLRVFSDPASVAVVGASDDVSKWGYWLARGALRGSHTRAIWLVNQRAEAVYHQQVYATITSLPETPELVVVCVPARYVHSVVKQALARGTRGFLIITAGVPEQQRLLDMIRAAGAHVIGPNSLGAYDSSTELELAWGNFSPGPVAVISQSGQLGLEIASLGAQAGLGISRFYSVGNQLDVNAADLLEDLIHHEPSKVVALYLESFADGERIVAALKRLRNAGKRAIVITTGASASSQRLAQSHTGSMTSGTDTIDAACRAAGAVRVDTPGQLVDLARYLTVAPAPQSHRVAIISDSGGQGGIAADLAEGAGLTTPVFSPRTQAFLAHQLPASASVANPVDLAGAGEANIATYARISEQLLESGEVDAVVLSGYFGRYGQDTPAIQAAELAVVDQIGAVVRRLAKPVIVHSMSPDSAAMQRMWEQGLPAFNRIDSAIQSLATAFRSVDYPGRATETVSAHHRAVPSGYWAARELLASHNIAIPAAARLRRTRDVDAATGSLQAPFVLKAGWLAHKSEHKGIVLGLADSAAVTSALDDMIARLGDGEYVLEELDTRDHVVEMLIGAQRDAHFGPMISVGAGGTQAELWSDVCTELAPVDVPTAHRMIERLQSVALLRGWRGSPPVDHDSLAAMVVAVSQAIYRNGAIAELEINPVRVGVDGALAVDALVTCVS